MGRSIQPIVHGTASGGARDAVVVLARFEAGVRVGLCTATVVAPDLVVTARHCVSAVDPVTACDANGNPVAGAMLKGDRAPADLAIFASQGGRTPNFDDESFAVTRGKALVVDDATTICNRDLAFVILTSKLKAPVAPIRLGPPSLGEPLTAVGFGVDETGEIPASRMERSGLSLLGAGPMTDPNDARYGIGDGELFVSESACAGDSGSPLLAKSGAILGVASRAGNGQPRDPNNLASTCVGPTAHAVYAQLGAAKALALRAFAEAGATPWLEGQPDPYAPRAGAKPNGGEAGAASGATATPPGAIASRPIPPSSLDDPEPSAGGCAASREPTRDAGPQTLGAAALLAGVLGLRRRPRGSSRLRR
ncbi:MAG: trypsin-like serine protease [Deltaproteobacteria bacterium]|nr:trypsin-like serine protease [Deltaproteobacteria bacterium]